jgi:hypothetical protein
MCRLLRSFLAQRSPTSVLWSVTPSGPWVSEIIQYKDVSKDLE